MDEQDKGVEPKEPLKFPFDRVRPAMGQHRPSAPVVVHPEAENTPELAMRRALADVGDKADIALVMWMDKNDGKLYWNGAGRNTDLVWMAQAFITRMFR